MPDCFIVAVLILLILLIVIFCIALVCAAWCAFRVKRMHARYRADAARVRAAIRLAPRIADHRMNLQ